MNEAADCSHRKMLHLTVIAVIMLINRTATAFFHTLSISECTPTLQGRIFPKINKWK